MLPPDCAHVLPIRRQIAPPWRDARMAAGETPALLFSISWNADVQHFSLHSTLDSKFEVPETSSWMIR
jgi:hypothetical protein